MGEIKKFKYPAVIPQRKTGSEEIVGIENQTLLDFWQWAYSNILDNAERGVFAEWLVAKALDCVNDVRVEWDKFDIITDDGIKVEVKSSGYLQSWGQKTLSKIVFGIQQTKAWDYETNQYEFEKKRQADIYVFCVHKHTHQESVNPIDVSQWDFYVISTNTLNTKIGSQKSISLNCLLKIGAEKVEYKLLKKAVTNLYKGDF